MRTSHIAQSHAVRLTTQHLRAFWVLFLVQGIMVAGPAGIVVRLAKQAASY